MRAHGRFGGAMTFALALLASQVRYAPATLEAILAYWGALPHLLMSLGYAALLVRLCRRSRSGWLTRRLTAVGQLALTNYLGCSLVFTAIFYGWGLGLIGAVSPRWQWGFVLGGWIIMLWWSPHWLARFGQGPVERLWRSLSQGSDRSTRSVP